tara:strand:+ start:4004 stop:4585 length:582 start_codon:yes stop_codon:yes gene_type:complete
MASSITYEYRAWLRDVQSIAILMRACMDPEEVEERVDTYFMGSGDGRLLAKLRGNDRFEIKALVGREEAGEIWRRAVSETFPLRRPTVEKISCLFGTTGDAAKLIRTHLELREAFQACATPIPVRKKRFHLRTERCRAELTHVTMDGMHFQTAAIECEDAKMLRSMISSLALTRWPNLNYGAWLRSRMRDDRA